MRFFSRFSPKVAIEDFATEWRQPTPHRWKILGVAVAATFSMLFILMPDSERAAPARPEITYISTWAPDRTEAEIVASNLANQQRKDERASQLAQLEEQRRENFRALGRASFIDVDALEEQYADEAAGSGAAASSAPIREPAPAPPRGE